MFWRLEASDGLGVLIAMEILLRNCCSATSLLASEHPMGSPAQQGQGTPGIPREQPEETPAHTRADPRHLPGLSRPLGTDHSHSGASPALPFNFQLNRMLPAPSANIHLVQSTHTGGTRGAGCQEPPRMGSSTAHPMALLHHQHEGCWQQCTGNPSCCFHYVDELHFSSPHRSLFRRLYWRLSFFPPKFE